MKQELIQQIQDNITLKLINTNIENLDIFVYKKIIDTILLIINSIVPDCQLNKNNVNHELESDYILIAYKEPIKILDGNLAIMLNLNDFLITNIEVSVIY